ncbi:MAG: glucose-6-phosphate isomerase [Candidatus Omnitrophica bacterium]|nr:glucose-6-phosphate isomerase [Candidatus Omnitrophota bacterium]MBL7151315.1 glucose-6-phosphate isomerase [Candidatus Omnitrophota bacterium]MBL7210562.1 glucose-6-phosphate isomerase [Candidatus Omnitrophota bacterium]
MTTDLSNFCGLQIQLDTEKPALTSGEGLNFSKPGVRTLQEMREVLLDKAINAPQELYYMYRDVYEISDKPLLEKHSLRFDLTLIKPDALGRELMKTAGHYHPGSFGELYEVVAGRCYCLMQKCLASDYQAIEEVIVVEAAAGEKIVIPPGFGHILINPGPKHLVTSNWVSSRFSSEYELYKKAQGAAYFVIGPADKPQFIPNPNFKKLPGIKFVRPARVIEKFGLSSPAPMYPLIRQDAGKLDFLNRPLGFDYSDIFVKP